MKSVFLSLLLLVGVASVLQAEETIKLRQDYQFVPADVMDKEAHLSAMEERDYESLSQAEERADVRKVSREYPEATDVEAVGVEGSFERVQ